MSELTDLHRPPAQTRIFDGDDPRLVGYAPHSRHCRATEQRSRRFAGEPKYVCVTSCPRKAQLDRELGDVVIDRALLDLTMTAIEEAP